MYVLTYAGNVIHDPREEGVQISAGKLVEESGQAFTCALSLALEFDKSEVIIVSAEGGKYELFNISNGTVTATFTPVKTSRY